MALARLLPAIATILLLAGCPGSNTLPPTDLARYEGPAFVDGPRLDARADRGREGTASPDLGPAPNPCTAKTGDGTALNPGCDPDVQVNGLTAAGEFRNGSGAAAWILTSGKKFWIFDPQGGGVGAFTGGGKDLATTIAGLPPTSCAVKSADGVSLNPGCDVDVQANGPSSIGEFVNPTTKAAAWLFTAKKKWWLFDPQSSSFTAAGASLAEAFKLFSPACSVTTSDGIPLNAGCDTDVAANGLSAASEFVNPQTGASAWLFTSGPRWWVLDPASSSFVAGGKNFATLLEASFQPSGCTATTSDGLPLNPGCDTDFIANGPSVVGAFKGSGTAAVWLFTAGKKWWIYDPATATRAFVAGGKEIASFLRTLKP